MSKIDLLQRPLTVVNLGVAGFHEAMRTQKATSVLLDWRPPCGGDAELIALVERLTGLDSPAAK